jgi:LysM repeat protein
VDQIQTKSAVSTVTCDDCFLKAMQTQLQMPLLSNPDMATTFTSLTKKCSKTGFSVTSTDTKTQWVIRGTPVSTSGGDSTPKPTGCVGTTYTVKSGDTCQSISLSQSISTGDLLEANNLQAFCEKFPKSGSLCIPTAAKCKTYTVETGDTCTSIADAHGLTWTQVVTWNDVFGLACQNIERVIGYTACVSNPGGDWVNPKPSSISTSSDRFVTPTNLGTVATLLPKPTFGGSLNGSGDWTYKYADGTRLDCYIYANGSQFGNSASCKDVAKGYGVSTQNLTDWNPSLLTNSCTLDGKLTYCVQLMALNATNSTPYCVLSDTPDYGLTCDQFLAVWGIDVEMFSSWNPSVGPTCENWLLGTFTLHRVVFIRLTRLQVESTALKCDTSGSQASCLPVTSMLCAMSRTVSVSISVPFFHS